jgi:hypothetical protein
MVASRVVLSSIELVSYSNYTSLSEWMISE